MAPEVLSYISLLVGVVALAGFVYTMVFQIAKLAAVASFNGEMELMPLKAPGA